MATTRSCWAHDRSDRFVHERRYVAWQTVRAVAWQTVRAVAWQTVRAVAHFDLSFGVRFILHILRAHPNVRSTRSGGGSSERPWGGSGVRGGGD